MSVRPIQLQTLGSSRPILSTMVVAVPSRKCMRPEVPNLRMLNRRMRNPGILVRLASRCVRGKQWRSIRRSSRPARAFPKPKRRCPCLQNAEPCLHRPEIRPHGLIAFEGDVVFNTIRGRITPKQQSQFSRHHRCNLSADKRDLPCPLVTLPHPWWNNRDTRYDTAVRAQHFSQDKKIG